MEEIGKILPKILKPQFARLEPPVVEVLAPLWSQVAGKVLAKECRPVAFSAGGLTLETRDPEWIEPLQEMAEELRAHVNIFLGRPVVTNLRIACARKRTSGDRALRRPGHLPGSDPGLRNLPRQGPRMASGMAEVIGRSRVKDLAHKQGKVH
jgi:hypothetical protein